MGGKGAYREDYTPMIQQVQHVEYGNADAMEAAIKNLTAVGEKVAGVIIEPIQGEAGVIIPPAGYFKKVREICDKYNVALILDEIQTGMGRCGTMWRCEYEGIVPDIMTYGKAFGGGIMPITGIIARPKMWVENDRESLILGSQPSAAIPCAPRWLPSSSCSKTTFQKYVRKRATTSWKALQNCRRNTPPF
jgi:putrescine aminotransferase